MNASLTRKKKDLSDFVSVDDRMISLLRFLLSLSALLVIYIDPLEPNRFFEVTYTVLILYCLYSLVLYLMSTRQVELIPASLTHWIDVAWYSVLISLSSGTNSIYFFFYFFSILVAAFRYGFNTGISVATVSAIVFSVVGYLTTPSEQEVIVNRFLLRPIYLLMLGYMISFWGGREIKLRKRLALLKDVNRLSNPRLGVDQTLFTIMERLRAFYDADSCLLILKSSSSDKYFWREVNRDKSHDAPGGEETEAVAPLLTLPGEFSLLYQSKRNILGDSPHFYVTEPGADRTAESRQKNFAALADLLEAGSFVTVPLHQHGEIVGRIYLTSQKIIFESSDVEFVRQFGEQILPAVENIQLLDLLASEAVGQHSQKISRDIHDSTLQPYIGIKLGLEALEMKSSAGQSIHSDIKKLISLADSSIADLRGYISKLRGETVENVGEVLVTALEQQASKFQQFYGIRVLVNFESNVHISDRLAAEVFQMLMEGLSNIRRHTKAASAAVRLRREAESLELTIENEESGPVPDFLPKTIAGRAGALGGAVQVERLPDLTRVLIKIPL